MNRNKLLYYLKALLERKELALAVLILLAAVISLTGGDPIDDPEYIPV
jgi:hypothetical protein